MTGIGSIVNAGAIVVGGCAGLAAGSLIGKRVQSTLVSGMAIGTMFIGAGTTFSKMLAVGHGGTTLDETTSLKPTVEMAATAAANISFFMTFSPLDGEVDFGVSDAKILLGVWGMGNGLQQVCHQHSAAGGIAGLALRRRRA